MPRRKFDLAHMRTLAASLGDPERRFPSILIAGTNGKGSTAATLASILASAGYRTGLYTSPHLVRSMSGSRLSVPTMPSEYASMDVADQRGAATADADSRRGVCAALLCADSGGEAAGAESVRFRFSPSFFEMLTAVAFAVLCRAPCRDRGA